MKLLTESEVAELLRCSREKIKRLRLSGQIRYIPGKPILIDEEDLKAFIEAQKVGSAAQEPRPSKDLDRSPQAARKWALQQVLLRGCRRKKGGDATD